MNTILRVFLLMLFVAGTGGCAKMKAAGGAMAEAPASPAAGKATRLPDRMLVWNAYLDVEVWSVSNATQEAAALADRNDGFMEKLSDGGERYANLTLRIPAKNFTGTLASLSTLGTVTRRTVDGEDVTEAYIDMEARLKNAKALRGRLQQLLDKAADVKDILAIEAELNRIQGDIDSMEGRLKALKGQVDYASIDISFERKPIPGPLGYLMKGAWWCVGKLFFIRD